MILVVSNKAELETWVNTFGDQFSIVEIKGLLTRPPTDEMVNLVLQWVSAREPHRILVVDSRTTRCCGFNNNAMALAVAVANQVPELVQLVWNERGHQHYQVISPSRQLIQLPLLADHHV